MSVTCWYMLVLQVHVNYVLIYADRTVCGTVIVKVIFVKSAIDLRCLETNKTSKLLSEFALQEMKFRNVFYHSDQNI